MSVRVRAGEMRERITLQTSTGFTRSIGGAPSRTWSTLATVWAKVVTSGGREFAQGGAEATEARALFNIRYRSDVTTEHRVAFPTTTDVWDIESVEDIDGMNKMLNLLATKRTT